MVKDMKNTPPPPDEEDAATNKKPIKRTLKKLGAANKLKPLNSALASMSGRLVQQVDTTKTYTLHTDRTKRGTKILLYAVSGMGKTTLATLAPKPVFVAADDGIDEIMHPVTGDVVPHYVARTYEDVRNILNQPKLFEGFETIVLDTMTEVEALSVPYILENVLKDGKKVGSIEAYGWGSGYAHISEHDNHVKSDLQNLVHLGYNVIVICQSAPRKEASATTDDYLKEGPKLVYKPNVKAFAATDFVDWADHCFRIGYIDLAVNKNRATTTGTRAVFVQPDATFEAKSRTIPGEKFPVVSFENRSDDSIWRFVFDHAWKNLEDSVDAD